MSSQDSPFFDSLDDDDGWTYLSTLDDRRTWRVDQCGWYEEFVTLSLAQLEPTEPDNDKRTSLIDEYATQYLAGSQFPPLSVRGLQTGYTTYQINNGHHRRLAALKAKCSSLDVWTNFYVDYHFTYQDGTPGQASHCALMADTQIGRKLENILARTHCPCCGHYLNYDGRKCGSCGYPDKMGNGAWEFYAKYPHRLLDESITC